MAPAIVPGELRVSLRLRRHRDRNEEALREFLEHPVVEPSGVALEVTRHHADLVVELRREGTPIPTDDLWIAATAAREGGARSLRYASTITAAPCPPPMQAVPRP